MWELDLHHGIQEHSALSIMATNAAALLARHGMVTEAFALLHQKRPDIPTDTRPTVPDIYSHDMLTHPHSAKPQAAAKLAALLNLSTIDDRKNVMYILGIPENAIDLDGSGTQFAQRLLRYVNTIDPSRLPALRQLISGGEEEANGEQQ